MVADIFQQNCLAETAQATEIGGQIETTQADAMGTYGASPLVQVVPPKP